MKLTKVLNSNFPNTSQVQLITLIANVDYHKINCTRTRLGYSKTLTIERKLVSLWNVKKKKKTNNHHKLF